MNPRFRSAPARLGFGLLMLFLWAGLARSAVAHDATGASATTPSSFNPEAGVLGNKDGRVKVVAFFDYNCGPCRRVYPDMVDLAGTDRHLEIVLIDLPILGEGSREAARVAIAARMQDPEGVKFLAFHRKMMSHYGPNDGERAIAAAQTTGYDMARLARDMADPQVDSILSKTMVFARAAGVAATPSFLMDGHVYSGEDGFAALRYRIEDLPK